MRIVLWCIVLSAVLTSGLSTTSSASGNKALTFGDYQLAKIAVANLATYEAYSNECAGYANVGVELFLDSLLSINKSQKENLLRHAIKKRIEWNVRKERYPIWSCDNQSVKLDMLLNAEKAILDAQLINIHTVRDELKSMEAHAQKSKEPHKEIQELQKLLVDLQKSYNEEMDAYKTLKQKYHAPIGK